MEERAPHDVPQMVRHVLVSRGSVAEESLSDDATLADLGVDSIDLALVFAEAERRHDIDFENEEVSLARYQTLGDLIESIEHRVTSRR